MQKTCYIRGCLNRVLMVRGFRSGWRDHVRGYHRGGIAAWSGMERSWPRDATEEHTYHYESLKCGRQREKRQSKSENAEKKTQKWTIAKLLLLSLFEPSFCAGKLFSLNTYLFFHSERECFSSRLKRANELVKNNIHPTARTACARLVHGLCACFVSFLEWRRHEAKDEQQKLLKNLCTMITIRR